MQYRSWLLAGLVAQAGVAQAMGLGEMDIRSYLGSPLQAQLNLFSPGSYEQQEIQVRIARPEIYQRLGARFDPFHSQIAFDVARDSQGQIQIRASSRNRVTEPFLDIVVELSWPDGTTYRRYNLLLDPPEYALRWKNNDRRPLPVENAALQLARQSPPPARPAVSQPAAARPAAPAPVEGQPYRVRSGDSLWKIARHLSGNGATSVHATMQALYAANPDAFIQGDRDRLKLGAVLHLPSGSLPEALAQAPASANTVAPAQQQAPLQTQAPQQPGQPVDELAAIKADIIRLQQDKLELQQYRQQLKAELATVLEQRIAATEALIQAENQQRQLNPALQSARSTPAAPHTPATSALAQPQPAAAQQPAIPQPLSQQPATPQPPAATPPSLSEMRMRDLLAMAEPDAASSAELLAPAPARLHSGIDKGNIGLWSLLAMLPLGVLVALMGMRSRRVQRMRGTDKGKNLDLHDRVFGSHRDRSRQESPDALQQALNQIREKADSHDRQRQQQQMADALEARDDLKQMVDLYLVYSQYQKALNVILTEITKRPGDANLRLYLMQVYAAMGDWHAFTEQEDVLRRLGQHALLEQAQQLHTPNAIQK